MTLGRAANQGRAQRWHSLTTTYRSTHSMEDQEESQGLCTTNDKRKNAFKIKNSPKLKTTVFSSTQDNCILFNTSYTTQMHSLQHKTIQSLPLKTMHSLQQKTIHSLQLKTNAFSSMQDNAFSSTQDNVYSSSQDILYNSRLSRLKLVKVLRNFQEVFWNFRTALTLGMSENISTTGAQNHPHNCSITSSLPARDTWREKTLKRHIQHLEKKEQKSNWDRHIAKKNHLGKSIERFFPWKWHPQIS